MFIAVIISKFISVSLFYTCCHKICQPCKKFSLVGSSAVCGFIVKLQYVVDELSITVIGD